MDEKKKTPDLKRGKKQTLFFLVIFFTLLIFIIWFILLKFQLVERSENKIFNINWQQVKSDFSTIGGDLKNSFENLTNNPINTTTPVLTNEELELLKEKLKEKINFNLNQNLNQ